LGRAVEALGSAFEHHRPLAVVVQGDTNAAAAGALAANGADIPVVHVEAGLRSFDRRMPEEVNRVVADHLSSFLFSPTATGVENLRREGITKGVELTGDVMLDVFREHLDRAPRSSRAATFSRHSTETPAQPRLGAILKGAGDSGLRVVPMHPRTRPRAPASQVRRTSRSSGGRLPEMLPGGGRR
jgi:UDP-N-acetylglucosamine 2-epimerase